MQKVCKSCANLLLSDSASSGYRCGEKYFNQSPTERTVKRMDTYPETDELGGCDLYRSREGKLRTDLTKQTGSR